MRSKRALGSSLLAVLAACSSGDATGLGAPESQGSLEHPYFPLQPGIVWLYVGEDDGVPIEEEVTVLDAIQWSNGAECFPVQQRLFVEGEFTEVTTEWFAPDAAGNIWQLGEESWLVTNGVLELSPDSWWADRDGAQAVLVLSAEPRVGQVLLLEFPHGAETLTVESLTATAATPAGSFARCLEVHEDAGGDQDILLYAPGTGLAEVRSANGYRLLAATRRKP